MGKKYLRFFVAFLLFSFQGVFLAFIFREAFQSRYALLLIPVVLFIATGLAATYLKVQLHDSHYHYEDFWVAIWVPVGAVACYGLNIKAGLGPVVAAGIVGTVGSYLPSFYRKGVYLKKIPFAVYCGAFIGMCSAGVAPHWGFVLGAGFVAGTLLLLSKSLFLGMGGKLGLLAFGGVVVAAFVFHLTHVAA